MIYSSPYLHINLSRIQIYIVKNENEVKVMVYLVLELWYPPGKESEAGNKYLEIMKKYPPDPSIAEAVVPFAVNSTPEGTHTFTVSTVKKGKLEEAIKRTTRSLLEFSVEGMRYQIRTYLTAPEAMSLIKLQMPE